MLNGITAATTQLEYYTEVVKLVGLFLGITLGTVSFFAIIMTIVAYARYSR